MFRVSQLGQHPGLGVVCFRPHCPILKRAVAGFEVVQLSRGETARRGRTQSPSTCHRAALGNLPVIENAITVAPRFPLGKKQLGRASRNPPRAPQETEPTPARLAAPVLIRHRVGAAAAATESEGKQNTLSPRRTSGRFETSRPAGTKFMRMDDDRIEIVSLAFTRLVRSVRFKMLCEQAQTEEGSATSSHDRFDQRGTMNGSIVRRAVR